LIVNQGVVPDGMDAEGNREFDVAYGVRYDEHSSDCMKSCEYYDAVEPRSPGLTSTILVFGICGVIVVYCGLLTASAHNKVSFLPM
jgi:hypothetical protein